MARAVDPIFARIGCDVGLQSGLRRDALAVSLHEFAEERVTRAVGVHIGGVNEIVVCFSKDVVHFLRFVVC